MEVLYATNLDIAASASSRLQEVDPAQVCLELVGDWLGDRTDRVVPYYSLLADGECQLTPANGRQRDARWEHVAGADTWATRVERRDVATDGVEFITRLTVGDAPDGVTVRISMARESRATGLTPPTRPHWATATVGEHPTITRRAARPQDRRRPPRQARPRIIRTRLLARCSSSRPQPRHRARRPLAARSTEPTTPARSTPLMLTSPRSTRSALPCKSRLVAHGRSRHPWPSPAASSAPRRCGTDHAAPRLRSRDHPSSWDLPAADLTHPVRTRQQAQLRFGELGQRALGLLQERHISSLVQRCHGAVGVVLVVGEHQQARCPGLLDRRHQRGPLRLRLDDSLRKGVCVDRVDVRHAFSLRPYARRPGRPRC